MTDKNSGKPYPTIADLHALTLEIAKNNNSTSEDELVEIRDAWLTYAGPLEPAIQHVRFLLAEVDRVRAENTALREIVEELQSVPPYSVHDNTDCFFHGGCYPELVRTSSRDDGYWKHHPDCLVTKAREMVKGWETLQ